MIIVTGASRGLGAAICERLVRNGEEVFGLSRSDGDFAWDGMVCDVTSKDELRKVASYLRKRKASVTGLVNAAGIASMNLALTTPESSIEAVMRTNLFGTIFSCQSFAPLMIRSSGGSIVNFSTIAVSLGLRGESVYVASKAGVEGFSYAFAREMSDFNIRVNNVAPGPINTTLLKGVSDDQIHNIVKRQVLRRQFDTDDVADIVEFLLSEKSRSISGQVMHIGGV